ncbi:MAG: tRNA (adenine-N1)-methyltransferase [Acidimicrobiales bacterium]
MTARSNELSVGELVLIIDNRDRRHLITLAADGAFHSHAGVLDHSKMLGQPEGCEVATTKGQKFRVFRPTLEEFILSMPRGAQVIYPKDLGPMMMLADIAPGMKVFESGIGSGALSMTLLRAGADIVGYELREDFAARAKKNVETFLGPEVLDRYQIEIRSAYESIDGNDFDRVMLDLPEPWQVVPHAEMALKPGGVFMAYTPSITQASRLREALAHTRFTEMKTLEVLNRGWHIEGQAVRPDHRMVAHTAFLTRARLLAPTAGPPSVQADHA